MIQSQPEITSYIQPRRLRFTVDQYYQMIEMGMIDDYEKSEIIDGEMVPKMSIGDRHAWIVNLLMRFLNRDLPEYILVSGQNPLRLGDYDEPEPDVVLADLTKYDGKRHPRPAETLVVIEVADTSLNVDRNTKLPLYAASGILEVWIVNLKNDIIEVHYDLNSDIYQTAKVYRPGETAVSTIVPELSIKVSDLIF